MRDLPADRFFIDPNGLLAERRVLGGQEVVVHYDDIPESDVTVHRGLRVTTPLRTVLDLAPYCEPAELDEMVSDCLRRQLFTLAEAWARLAQPDMRSRPGALMLGDLLRRRFGEP